ncbi:MT-A70-domain-containing protein [Jackrogersella minutella]|nr:MT-A70-domain-containing protein [Jackrogersella minutella]
MPSEAVHHQSRSCLLFESPDKTIVLIDIPRSIEEAQLSPGQAIKRHIISCSPVEIPWKTPEPKKALSRSASCSAAIAELMTLEIVKAALQNIKHNYEEPWCLPRMLTNTNKASSDVLPLKESHKRKQSSDEQEIDVVPAEPYIPHQSRYLLGSIDAQRGTFLADAPMFDLVVLDPPWPSRSVRRKQNSYTIAYGMQEARDLLTQIPVASHLKPDGLVAIWVTNKAAATDLLTSPGGIFSDWGVEFVGEWIWLKITKTGDPVIDVEAQWRKPWERLLLGRKRGGMSKAPIPTKVIMGVPDVHSRKPNLKPLFPDILPANYNGLEVFARNLTSGWWSWGNQVLYFQQRHHWVEIDYE